MSRWVNKTIAVSEDIKKHLRSGFGFDGPVEVITNGIDANLFNKNQVDNQLFTTLDLQESTTKLLILSRLDGQLGTVAIDTIKSVRELIMEGQNIELIVCGDGDMMDEIKAVKATLEPEITNKIHILGKRTDTHKIIALCDFAIAVSRSALEIIFEEKPVILAGGEGYMGILNSENFENAINNNLTGRDHSLPYSKEALKNDITSLQNLMSEASYKIFLEKVQTELKEAFSLEKMIAETNKVYDELLEAHL